MNKKTKTDLNKPIRIIVEKVSPEIDGGEFSIKRVVGQKVKVSATVFADGHDVVVTLLLYRKKSDDCWHKKVMNPIENDMWEESFTIEEQEDYFYTIEGYIDQFTTWITALKKKWEAKQDLKVDFLVGIQIIESAMERSTTSDKEILSSYVEKIKKSNDDSAVELALSEELFDLMNLYSDKSIGNIYHKELRVCVEEPKALFSAWYEIFPRSCGKKQGKPGTFKDVEGLLPDIAKMGFNILYLSPIHPIGKKNRKGKNNNTTSTPQDPGSPWAIGSEEGGHKDIDSQIGTLDDFRSLVKKSKELNLDIAMDIAFQCAPDHPYVKEHPQWFKWKPDGSVQYAENPPKKYEDILPINFDTDDWKNLWEELKSIILFWIEQGVRIFRVDNPHTKPFVFWDWLISEVKKDYPDTIFLSEAFTRPNLMYRLAKSGFSQSYTYFTWRNTKKEFIDYINELTKTEIAQYFRPNFWPNTPDILPEYLQYGGRPAFIMRAVMAATLSSNYGIYGPAFELCVCEAVPNKEEYLDSEKYEIKNWDRNKEGHLKDVLARINKIRKTNPALQFTNNIKFCEINNEFLLAYYKATSDYSNIILVVVNLNPYHTQVGYIKVPLDDFGIEKDRPYLAHDLLTDDKYIWQGETSYIELDPHKSPAHIFLIKTHMHREQDFDYFV